MDLANLTLVFDQVASIVCDYVVLLIAVGGIAMAIVEVMHRAGNTRLHFHRDAVAAAIDFEVGRWEPADADDWDAQVERFFAGLAAVDERLAAPEPLGRPARRLLQGPFADALTHVGQIALLRRLAGDPVRGENYFKARIEIGRVGPDQAEPVFEFN